MSKRKDDELFWLLVVNGIFTTTLVLVDFFAAKWSVMPVWLKIGVALLHCATGFYWYKSIKNFNDPNYDYTRKVVAILSLLTIGVIMLHHSGWLEDKMFKESVEKNKTSVQWEPKRPVLNEDSWDKYYYVVFSYANQQLGITTDNILMGQNRKMVDMLHSNGGNIDNISFKVHFDKVLKNPPNIREDLKVYDVAFKGESL